ncbi:response regulator [Ectothiorhodospiraceae bacterium BW-2]|nr:response regulator [Ectothiorhodospiraceae bacterium BW-2]
MAMPIVICDDSSFARKQVARSLPEGWDVDISFATNGEEAVAALQAGKGDILFLDLTMPILDGFGVLERIRDRDLPTLPIVISGDIQPESQRRVKQLGAIAFIKKPVNREEIAQILESYGVLELLNHEQPPPQREESLEFHDWCQEIANVSMGRAADLLAQLIDDTVELSIPEVSMLGERELNRALLSSNSRGISHVVQGFTGSGLFGETVVVFHDIDFDNLAQAMRYGEQASRDNEVELLMELANVLVGSFLKGVSDLLHVTFSRSHPHLSLHMQGDEDIIRNLSPTERVLTIKLSYTIGQKRVKCDQLLLFPEASITQLQQHARFIVGEEL